MWIDGTRKPSCLRQILAQRFHPRQQLAALLGIDQRHQSDADFEHQVVELQHCIHGIDRRRSRLVALRRCAFGALAAFGCAAGFIFQAANIAAPPSAMNENLRHAGNQRQRQQDIRPQSTAGARCLNICLPMSVPSE